MASAEDRSFRDHPTFPDGLPDTHPDSIGVLGHEPVVRALNHYAGQPGPRRSPWGAPRHISVVPLVYGDVSLAHQVLHQREYPRPYDLYRRLEPPHLLEWLSLAGDSLLQSDYLLMSLMSLGVFVEVALLHIQDNPGWYDVLRQVLLLATAKGALLSLGYHLEVLGRSLGAAALGSPHDDNCFEVCPFVAGTVHRYRHLKYRLHFPLFRVFGNTIVPQRYLALLRLADAAVEFCRVRTSPVLRHIRHLVCPDPGAAVLRSWLHTSVLHPSPPNHEPDGLFPPKEVDFDPAVWSVAKHQLAAWTAAEYRLVLHCLSVSGDRRTLDVLRSLRRVIHSSNHAGQLPRPPADLGAGSLLEMPWSDTSPHSVLSPPVGGGDPAVQRLYTQILQVTADPPAVRPGRDDYEWVNKASRWGESAPLGGAAVGAVLAGAPLLREPSPQPPLPNFGLESPGPAAPGLRHSVEATLREMLSRTLSVEAADLYVTLRSMEMPVGVVGEVPLVDLRWANVCDFGELSGLVPSVLHPPRHRWLGLVLSVTSALVVPLPVRPEFLEGVLEELSLSAEGSLSDMPVAGAPDYGVFFDGDAGRIWALPEGRGLPEHALMLLPDGGWRQGVELVLPEAVLAPPPAGLWEVPLGKWAAVQAEHER